MSHEGPGEQNTDRATLQAVIRRQLEDNAKLRAAISRALALYESGDCDGTGGAAEVLRAAIGVEEGP